MSSKWKWIWGDIKKNPVIKNLMLAVACTAGLTVLDWICYSLIADYGRSFASTLVEVLFDVSTASAGVLLISAFWVLLRSLKDWHAEERQQLLEKGKVELILAPVTGFIFNRKKDSDDSDSYYLQYLLDDEKRQVLIKDKHLQEAVGSRIPVYVYRDGSGRIEPDPDHIVWSERTEMPTAPEPSESEESRELIPASSAESNEEQIPADLGMTAEEFLQHDYFQAMGTLAFGIVLSVLALIFLLVSFSFSNPVFPVFLASVVLFISLWILVTGCLKKTKVREMEKIWLRKQAVITSVEKGAKTGEGLQRYTVVCEAEGTEYRSETISPPVDSIGKTLLVLVSPKNEKEYRVMLDSGIK